MIYTSYSYFQFCKSTPHKMDIPGGSSVHDDLVALSRDPLDISALINGTRDSGAGAISTFIGTTRDNFEGDVTL